MRFLMIGAHLSDEHVRGIAEPIACGGLWLSGIPVAGDQPLADRELLQTAARVRGELLDRATFVAIRYGFAATPADAAAKCAAYVERWKRLLEANCDNVEMTLKVVAKEPRPRPDRRDFASGADYLRALHDAAQAADVNPTFREAVSSIGTHRWAHRDGRSLECALLVPRAEVARVQQAGERLKRDFPDIPFLLSGPWPLEAFVDHE
jgi:hypothetical protein